MKTTKQMSTVILRGLLILALVFGLTPLAQAQTQVAKGKAPAAKAKPPAHEKSSGGPQEGIKMHGHWTIVIRNADGSVASQYRFQNALTPAGARALAQILGRAKITDLWWLELFGNNGPCIDSLAAPGPCFISEPGAIVAPSNFSNLVVSLPTTGPDAGKLVLAGSAKTTFAGNIGSVSTLLKCRLPSGTFWSCGPGTVSDPRVTDLLLPSQIPVQANQTIDVTVVLSFS